MPVSTPDRIVKRTFDVLVAGFALVIMAPVLVAAAVAVRFVLGRPVLFRQVRPGLKARPFTIHKFRTMSDTRDSSGALRPDAERLGRLGRWLRATSIDELPELWDVLRGEMSIVGPRPLLMQYLDRYTTEQARRMEVKPGITGLAQVSGRNAVGFQERFELDVRYVDTWSFGLDLRIIARSLRSVIGRRGISQEGHATSPEWMGNA